MTWVLDCRKGKKSWIAYETGKIAQMIKLLPRKHKFRSPVPM